MEEIYKSEDFRQKTLLAKKLNYYSNRVHEIHYSDLVARIRENNGAGGLIPGMQYRIIDYKTTVNQSGCSTDERLFDVIVTALTPNTLDENARCCTTNRTQTNTQSLGNPAGWKIKYSVTNPSWCAWANVLVENGYKGTIYYMEDEFGNEAYYDFKTIRYTSYTIVNKSLVASYSSGLSNKVTSAVSNYSDLTKRIGDSYALINSTIPAYTFNHVDNWANITSSTVNEASCQGYCKNNKIYLSSYVHEGLSSIKLPTILLFASSIITSNKFNSSINITLESYHNPSGSTSSGGSGPNIDNGVIKQNIFNNCNNTYLLNRRLYSCNFYDCSNSVFACWGNDSENYMYDCSRVSGNDNCIWCGSAIKRLEICNRASTILLSGTSVQCSTFGYETADIRWINVSGYFLYNDIKNKVTKITINCPWFNTSTILSGATNLAINYSGVISFTQPMQCLVVYPGNYNNAVIRPVTTTGSGDLRYSQTIMVTNSKTITV